MASSTMRLDRTDVRNGHREHYPAAGVCEADQGGRCEKGTDQTGMEQTAWKELNTKI